MTAPSEPETGRDMLSPKEIADRIGLSYRAVLRAIRRGDLEASEPVPGRLRIDVEEYERWRSTPRHDQPPRPSGGKRPGRRRSERASFMAELQQIEERAA